MALKKKGRLSAIAKSKQRSVAAKKGWLTRKANAAARRRLPIAEARTLFGEDVEFFEFEDDWEDIVGIDSVYEEA